MNFVQEELIKNQLVQIFPVFSRAIKYRGQKEKDSERTLLRNLSMRRARSFPFVPPPPVRYAPPSYKARAIT